MAVVCAVGLVAAGAASARLLWNDGSDTGTLRSSDEVARSVQPSGAAHASTAHPEALPDGSGGEDDLAARLELVKQATAKYKDVTVAESEGFRLIVRELPGMGAHFVKISSTPAHTFDPSYPNMLLYKNEDGSWQLLAVGYILSKTAFPGPPEYFTGAHWHSHQWLCIFSSGSVGIMPKQECGSKGGYWVEDTGWMLHVWLYRQNPAGVFAELNSTV